MRQTVAITVNGPGDEVRRLWGDSPHRPRQVAEGDAAVSFADAPGDRGTEIRIVIDPGSSADVIGGLTKRLRRTVPLAEAKDGLRRFKQYVEAGEVARSDGTPEGESLWRKPVQRPAQPTGDGGHQPAGA